MSTDKADACFKLGQWRVNPTECQLEQADTRKSIEPKTMELLVLLATAEGKLVSRAELMEVLWQGRYVTDYALNNLVANLRKQLAEGDSSTEYITTRPKLGYQLALPVEWQQVGSPTQEVKAVEVTGNAAMSSDISRSAPTQSAFSMSRVAAVCAFVLVFAMTAFALLKPSPSETKSFQPSIAILPLDAMSEGDDVRFFADGLAEEIIHQIALDPAIKVIARTSSFSFRGQTTDVADIAKKLDVAYVVEGSVREEGDGYRVIIQLIGAKDAAHLWSQAYDANPDNNFAVQQEISAAIMASIDPSFVSFAPDRLRYQSNSGEAYLRHLQAKELSWQYTPEAIRQALRLYDQVTQLDPEYAEAYIGVALSHLILYGYRQLSLEDAVAKAQIAINNAFALNPNYALAHTAQGLLYKFQNDFTRAKAEFDKALALNPGLYVALGNYAHMSLAEGDNEAALDFFQRAKQAAPLDPGNNWGVGAALIRLGRWEDATASYLRCNQLLPDYRECYMGLAYVYRLTNRHQLAEQAYAKLLEVNNQNDYTMQQVKAFHLTATGNHDQAEAIYQQLFDLYQYDIASLPSLGLMHWRRGAHEDWLSQIQSANEQIPDNKNILAALAMAGYQANRCDVSINAYERLFRLFPAATGNFAEMAEGSSHAANLAYCYQQLGPEAKLQEQLAILDEQFKSYRQGDLEVPGVSFILTKYNLLKGDFSAARQEYERLLRLQWSQQWLVEDDPLIKAGALIEN